MAVVTLLVRRYAFDIYIQGIRSFSTIPAEYHEPVKQHAALNFTQPEIDNALAKGYISPEEYNETMAYKA